MHVITSGSFKVQVRMIINFYKLCLKVLPQNHEGMIVQDSILIYKWGKIAFCFKKYFLYYVMWNILLKTTFTGTECMLSVVSLA